MSSTDGGVTWTATFTPDAPIEDSSNQIRLNLSGVSDIAGNQGAGSVSTPNFAIDTSAPVAPGATLASDTGSSNSDAITQVGNLNITGIESGATVEYSVDGGSSWTGSFTAVEGDN
ncbi:MAG: glycosyl hydrolase, partial [Desulfuromonas sp.]